MAFYISVDENNQIRASGYTREEAVEEGSNFEGEYLQTWECSEKLFDYVTSWGIETPDCYWAINGDGIAYLTPMDD